MNAQKYIWLALLVGIAHAVGCQARPARVVGAGITEANALPADAALKGFATCTVNSRVLTYDEPVTVEAIVHVAAGSGVVKVLDAFNNNLLPATYRITLFDANMHELRDLIGGLPMGGSMGSVAPRDWVEVYSGACVGRDFTITPFPRVEPESDYKQLPAGRYFLQIIYFDSFIGRYRGADGHIKSANGDTGSKMLSEMNRTELFRSNVVELELEKP